VSGPLLNRARADLLLRASGLDALIATSPLSVTYLTGYSCWLDGQLRERMIKPGGSDDLVRAIALLPTGKDPVLFVDELFAANAPPDAAVWTFGVPPLVGGFAPGECWAEDQLAAIAAALRASGMDGGTIGIESIEWREALSSAVPRARFRDCSALLRLMRVVKTDAHAQHVAELTTLADRAINGVVSAATSGTRLVGDLEDVYASALTGAAVDHVAFGLDGGIATRREAVLPEDAVAYLDHGCRSAWGVSDGGTTLALRPLTGAESDALSCMRDAVEAGAQMLVRGTRASAVYTAMRLVTGRYPGASPQGHGIGLEIREDPIIGAGTGGRLRDECIDEPADLELEPGMLVNLEASLFGIGRASVHVEETFAVGEHDPRPITALSEVGAR
jgi:Xaa-Pro dipeptidase